jgi:hypothetical protein
LLERLGFIVPGLYPGLYLLVFSLFVYPRGKSKMGRILSNSAHR